MSILRRAGKIISILLIGTTIGSTVYASETVQETQNVEVMAEEGVDEESAEKEEIDNEEETANEEKIPTEDGRQLDEQTQEKEIMDQTEAVEYEEINEVTQEEAVAIDQLQENTASKVRAFVEILYKECMNRTADEEGLQSWVNALSNGSMDASSVISFFVNSNEFQSKSLSNQEYVKVLYAICLGREVDAEGLTYWSSLLEGGQSRNNLLAQLTDSSEFSNICSIYQVKKGELQQEIENEGTIESFVARFYKKCMNRVASRDEVAFWANLLKEGSYTGEDFAHYFIFSDEFKAKNLSNEDYVETLYNIFFNRGSDEAGKRYWVSQFQNGIIKESLFSGFVSSNEFKEECSKAGIRLGEIDANGMLIAINANRTKNGMKPLKMNARLNECMQTIMQEAEKIQGCEALTAERIVLGEELIRDGIYTGVYWDYMSGIEEVNSFLEEDGGTELGSEECTDIGIAQCNGHWAIMYLKMITLPTDSSTVMEKKMVDEINKKRRSLGVSDLVIDSDISQVAQLYAEDIRAYQKKNGGNRDDITISETYGSVYDMLDSNGYYNHSKFVEWALSWDSCEELIDRLDVSDIAFDDQYKYVGVGYQSDGCWIIIYVGDEY